jgi:glycosyltransferase involved in cell wall biosynthesis
MINLMTPINQLGYGVAGLNILKALQKQTNVALHMIGQPQVTTEEDASAVRRGLEVAKLYDKNAPCVKIWHQNQMAERIGSGDFYGFPIFELDTFNDLEKHHLNSTDGLITCSKWASDVCKTNLGYSSSIAPLGVDMNIFQPATPRNDGKIIFFNCGKWEVRKSHDILIEAFRKVSQEFPNTELWMMCSNPFNSPEENAKWLQLYNHPKVKIIPRAETQRDVYNIMAQVTCGVFPSRGEGWNLELLEMMAVGKHVIATNYSAHTEFCTEDNCGLVPISHTEPAYDGKWFFGQGNWAAINALEIDILVRNMKNIASKYNGERNEAGIETAKQFTWEKTASDILKSIQ